MHRRAFLCGARALAAAAVLPRLGRAADVPGPVMERLSSYMADARNRALPADALEKTKHHTLDTLAAMISGSKLPPGRVAIAFARANAGSNVATVAGATVLCGPMEAALVNGMLAHSDETDDTHSPSQSHPGCGVVPAALAAGEKFGADGNRFLRAIALGYDVGPRVTMTLGALAYMDESHRSTHTISSEFGAAAAAGSVANLSSRQMRWVLDYAAQQASGIAAWQRDTEHIEKSLVFAGFGARSGVTAALLVQAGGTGLADIFTGPDNFFDAFNPKADREKLIEKLGERYEVTRTSIKKWTVGSPIQAPLDALQIMLSKHPFSADQVKSVIVRVATNEASIVNNREIPDICLQHMVAIMLLDQTASFKAAHDVARMKDPAVLRVRSKVQLIPDEELQRKLPAREAIVEVTLLDGTQLTERVEAVRGSAENPMNREEIISKSRDLIVPVLGADKANRLIDRIMNLEQVSDIRELRPLLQVA